MIVKLIGSRWHVEDRGRIVASFDTSAAAWRFIDRREIHELRYSNRAADRAGAWSLPKAANDNKGAA